MTSVPLTRDEMLNLKTKTDEKIRMDKVKDIVNYIYGYAANQAMSKTDTTYEYKFTGPQGTAGPYVPYDFYTKNMADILSGLQELFPGCLVMTKKLVMGQDGKMYDMALMNESILPFINQSLSQEYIVIDWT